MRRRRPFRPFRRARFLLIQTAALWLCLMLVTLTCTGLTQGEVVVTRALQHLGKPYVLGAEGPDRFDCSGLVMYCLIPEGFEFPLHSAQVIGTDERYPLILKPRELLAGDVVCFDTVRDKDPSD
ncbi:MAG: C40 family peptidase, partial [Clostridia bacterium]|nr:C40 family peptidase [Clostridia bacterium]